MEKNTTSRRSFIRNASAVAAVGMVPGAVKAIDPKPATAPATRKGPKRGVSLYSYSAEFGLTHTLENCFEDIHDMGATGIEILANAHIENYPYPTDEFLNHWWALCDKYEIEPGEYGHWIDGRVRQDRELTVDETVVYLERDMRIAHQMGFKCLRTKVTVKPNGGGAPIDNWREVVDKCLLLAERLDVRMLPEMHSPQLSDGFILDYIDYIKTRQTEYFGLNIDFGVFNTTRSNCSKPEELLPILPYIKCCHAKFVDMDDNYHETKIPYERILQIFVDNGWDGYLLSEYEGSDKYGQGYEVTHQLRKHHIMMKNILGY